MLRVLERSLCPLPPLMALGIADDEMVRRFVDNRRRREAQPTTIQRVLAGWILG